ncbi:MAG: hypothetical protein ACYSWU_06940 [Planctomycetota bacterium]|jgi:hypothetical protein
MKYTTASVAALAALALVLNTAATQRQGPGERPRQAGPAGSEWLSPNSSKYGYTPGDLAAHLLPAESQNLAAAPQCLDREGQRGY